ncbi:transposable element Tcb2 transposase [Trichonephila clavipes]|nr:transposable element Tcb2 transposase [Trichonephila clavipes]
MARRNHLDDFTRGRMIGKLQEGRTVTSVAAEFGINKSVVSRAWKAFQTTVSRSYGGLEVACPLRKPKVVGSTTTEFDRFSGCENRRHACHIIMWHAKDSLSINLVLVLSAIFSIRPEFELNKIQTSQFGSGSRQ